MELAARHCASIGLIAMLLASCSSLAPGTDPDAPTPVPGPFVDPNYGLIAEMPEGLTYCPLERDWIGSFHGYEAFLVAPSTCNPNRGVPYVAGSYDLELAPKIVIFYGYDVAPVHLDPNDQDDLRPSDPEALVERICREGERRPLPPGLKLLGMPAMGCIVDRTTSLEVALVTLYDASWVSDKHPEATSLVAVLYLTLFTSPGRLAQDLPTFRSVAASVRLCDPEHWHRPTPAPACPPWTWP